MADQVRHDALSAYGNEAIETTNLDALAAQGVRFDKAYSSTPVCTPARAVLLTSLKPWNNGQLAYGDLGPEYKQEMPKVLADLGYHTAMVGKNHFGWNKTTNQGVPHGFMDMKMYDGLLAEKDDYDKWFDKLHPNQSQFPEGLTFNTWRSVPWEYDENEHPTAWTGRESVKYIANYSFDKPLFLKSSFHRPHSPYDAPERLLNLVDESKMKPFIEGAPWDQKYANSSVCDSDVAWCGLKNRTEVQKSRKSYLANVKFVDEWIGQIVEALDARG